MKGLEEHIFRKETNDIYQVICHLQMLQIIQITAFSTVGVCQLSWKQSIKSTRHDSI